MVCAEKHVFFGLLRDSVISFVCLVFDFSKHIHVYNPIIKMHFTETKNFLLINVQVFC